MDEGQEAKKQSKSELETRIEAMLELSVLYDFYGELLSDHKKEIFEEYVLDNFSLSEIAEHAGISRQGVHDIVKRCSLQLKGFEEKLKLVSRFNHTRNLVERIRELSLALYQNSESEMELDRALHRDKVMEIAVITDEILEFL